MTDDVVSVCRQHPVKALLSALALGFIAGRLIRR
jgi:hypothetical protein